MAGFEWLYFADILSFVYLFFVFWRRVMGKSGGVRKVCVTI
jgi:hypothetical protein